MSAEKYSDGGRLALLCFDSGLKSALASMIQGRTRFHFQRVFPFKARDHAQLYHELSRAVTYELVASDSSTQVIGVVEMPPESPPKGKAPRSGAIGFSAGVFAGLCYGFGIAVVRVPVAEVRRVAFGRSNLSGAQAKEAAKIVAGREYNYLTSNDDEADALTVAFWAESILRAPRTKQTQTRAAKALIRAAC